MTVRDPAAIPPPPPFDEVMKVVMIHTAERYVKAGVTPPAPSRHNQPDLELWRATYDAMRRFPTVVAAAAHLGLSVEAVRRRGNRLVLALIDGGFLMANNTRPRRMV